MPPILPHAPGCAGYGRGMRIGYFLSSEEFGPADLLEEAVDVMRTLWAGGFVDYRGEFYQVDHARIYTLPDEPPKVFVSGFGPKSIDLAAEIGDGYISTKPDAEMVRRFRDKGGGDKP